MEMVSSLHLWKWLVSSFLHLWKWLVTACLVTYPVMQPFMETVDQQFCHLWNCAGAVVRKAVLPFMEMVGNRLWKWYVTALGNLTKLPKTICNRFRQPLMEMVCNRLSSYLPCYAAVYGNGWQAVLPLTELRSQLETERADRKETEAELCKLKQDSVPAATLPKKSTPDAATIFSQLRARRKKSKTDLADLEAILEILES